MQAPKAFKELIVKHKNYKYSDLFLNDGGGVVLRLKTGESFDFPAGHTINGCCTQIEKAIGTSINDNVATRLSERVNLLGDDRLAAADYTAELVEAKQRKTIIDEIGELLGGFKN